MAAAAGGSRLARSQSTTTTELSLGKTLRKVIRSGSKISGRSPISRRKAGSWSVVILPVLRIRDVYPGSRAWLFSIPYPGSELSPSRIRIKEFMYFNPKKPKKWFLSSGKHDPGCSSRIRMLTFYPSRIQGSEMHRIPDPDPQQWIGTSQPRDPHPPERDCLIKWIATFVDM
jgi:hypothetical protein